MKKIIFQSLSLIAIITTLTILVGWKKEVKQDIKSKYSANRTLISDTYQAGTCSDGKIEIAVWGDYVDGRVNNMQVAVDPGYVMIGGGAQVTNFSNTNVGVNALLTAAYPVNDGTFTTYGAASKDHQQLYNHRLWVYAIGLRIWGCTSNCKVPGLFTTTEIINGLNMSTVTSSPATSYPTAVVTVPAGYTALSGGAFIHWTGQGNLLVENGFPGIGVLASTGKDQVVVSPATITSYCLSYKSLQDCGSLSIQNVTNSALITQHAQSISQAADPGYLISGVAGLSFFDPGGFGRLLFAMYPNNSTSATVSSKDQGSTDIGGSLDITITEIKPNF